MLVVSLAPIASPLPPLRVGSRLKGFQWKWKRQSWYNPSADRCLPFRLKGQRQAVGKLRGFLMELRDLVFDRTNPPAVHSTTKCGSRVRLGSVFSSLKRKLVERKVEEEQLFALQWTRRGIKLVAKRRKSCCAAGLGETGVVELSAGNNCFLGFSSKEVLLQSF